MKAFVYLTDALFTEGSDFSEGMAQVVRTQFKADRNGYLTAVKKTPFYLSHAGVCYDPETQPIADLPKITVEHVPVDLHPFKHLNVWGYKDSAGNTVIEPRFDAAYEFRNGFAKVGIKKHFGKERSYSRPLKQWIETERTLTYWGLIDPKGKLVLPAEFIELGNVENNIVKYKKNELFEWSHYNGIDYNTAAKSKVVSLYGYFIFDELIPAIEKLKVELENLKKQLEELSILHEVDSCVKKIKNVEKKIELLSTTEKELGNN